MLIILGGGGGGAMARAVARALFGVCIFIYLCSARLISFDINLKTTDFKTNI